ncbi:MAG: hypothetical protein HYV78_01230 [Candidatus Wildermuthbacteria bacterium]|nr:hypothetical protein [Candidatus Wildermuthbacteria bacterium]
MSKPPTKEASPAVARSTRTTTENYPLLFSFCARRISFSLNEKSIFLRCFALTSKAVGLASIFLLGRLGIPPLNPPCRAVIAWVGGFFGGDYGSKYLY